MDELELLEQLQTIKNKLENNEVLTDDEYKLFASMIFAAAIGVMEKSVSFILGAFVLDECTESDESKLYNYIELPEEEDK